MGLVHDPAEAEDLTQETFLRAYRRGHTLRDPNAVRGWLYRVATNVSVDYLRRHMPQVSIDGDPAGHQFETSALAIAAGGCGTVETSACVQRCLDYLPDTFIAP
jgi:DNA-directed RNA polymerase specialized sigma24 family protein